MRRYSVLVVGVVVGGEGARRRAAVERLEHRRLDLEEAARVEEGAQRRARARLREQRDLGAPRSFDEQVEVALAVARLDVREAVPLLGQRPQALGEQLERARVDA